MTSQDHFTFTDIIYEKNSGIAKVIINRPDSYNSLTRHSAEEMLVAFRDAAEDDEIGVIVLTGSGEKAFCSGGHMRTIQERTPSMKRAHLRLMAQLAVVIRTCGKPVIAAVNGYAIGLGHELHVICDLTIAAEHAKFGQTGPKMGSVPIWATTQMLHRTVGEKKAREIVYLCRQYTAAEALEMGLINAVVPMAQLAETVDQWCQEILDKSPQTLRIAKMALNRESDQSLWGGMFGASETLCLHVGTEEFLEGPTAWLEKRKPNFRAFRKNISKE